MVNLPKISVVIRKRPLSRKELNSNDVDISEVRDNTSVIVREQKQKVDQTKYIEEHFFAFDAAFDEGINNQQLYQATVQPLIKDAFNKAKVTCFAYGQTGSGKTYTMIGDQGFDSSKNNNVKGLYLLAAQDIFGYIEMPEYSKFTVLLSFYEIYCGKLYDLLNNKNKLTVREDGKQNVNIIGLQQYQVRSVEKLMEIINFGNSMRVTGVTGANFDSSRSHAILQISLMTSNNKVHGKVSFIDLAGNERGADTYDQDKQTRLDGAEINQSLLALKECIRALDQDKKHIPFRGSCLTRVLKDSFSGGNCKTVMIGNISPSFSCCEHTLNTLRYADRVKELKKSKDDRNKGSAKTDMLTKELMLPRQQGNSIKVDLNNKVLKENSQNKAKDISELNRFKENNHQKKFTPVNANQKRAATSYGNYNNNQYHNAVSVNMAKQQSLDNDILNYGKNRHNHPNLNKNKSSYTNLNAGNIPNQSNMNRYDNPYKDDDDPMPRAPIANEIPRNFGRDSGLGNSNVTTNNMNNIPQAQTYDKVDYMGPSNKFNSDVFNMNKDTQNRNTPALPNNIVSLQDENEESIDTGKMNILGEQFNLDNMDLDKVNQVHEKLISVILTEEEDLIAKHREQLDKMCEFSRQEFKLLNDVEKPGSDIDGYVENLTKMLDQKTDSIVALHNYLKNFKKHLKEEQFLNNFCSDFVKQNNDDLGSIPDEEIAPLNIVSADAMPNWSEIQKSNMLQKNNYTEELGADTANQNL